MLICTVEFPILHGFESAAQSVWAEHGNSSIFYSVSAFLLAAAMRRIGFMRTSMIGSVGPVSTIYLAYVLLGKRLSLIQIIGSIQVLAGVLMISLQKQKRN